MARFATSPLMLTAKDDDLLGVSNRSDAMDGDTVALPKNLNNKLTADLYYTFRDLPFADHLHARLIDGHALNKQLADRLLDVEELEHRTFLASAARELPEHRATLEDAIRCEDLLAVVKVELQRKSCYSSLWRSALER